MRCHGSLAAIRCARDDQLQLNTNTSGEASASPVHVDSCENPGATSTPALRPRTRSQKLDNLAVKENTTKSGNVNNSGCSPILAGSSRSYSAKKLNKFRVIPEEEEDPEPNVADVFVEENTDLEGKENDKMLNARWSMLNAKC